MAKNILIVNYKVGSEAYQALSEMKRETGNDNYVILQAVVVKMEDGQLVAQDGFDTGVATADDTWKGGLLGSLIGILGGPFGVLLGGSLGLAIGNAVDVGDAIKNASLIQRAGECIAEGETALILLADEQYETALTAKLNSFDVTITRLAADEVEAEVRHAAEVERKLAKEEREKYIAEKREEINDNLTDLYNKSTDLKL